MPEQACLCSIGAIPETQCPAHPFRQKKEKPPKPNSEKVRAAECAACEVVGKKDHASGRHALGGYKEISKALTVGTVYCSTTKFEDVERLVVHDICHSVSGGFELYILEGWHTGPWKEIWMEGSRRGVAA